MGVLGGIPASIENLVYLVKTAREQLGEFTWSCAAAGKYQLPLTTVALAMGGNVRVGLEDNIYIKPGILAKSSSEQVTVIRNIAESLGKEIATPKDTRVMLSLNGL